MASFEKKRFGNGTAHQPVEPTKDEEQALTQLSKLTLSQTFGQIANAR